MESPLIDASRPPERWLAGLAAAPGGPGADATKEQLAQVVLDRYRIRFGDAAAAAPDRLALSLLPERACRRLLVLPWAVREDGLELLMANPLDVAAQEEAASACGRPVLPLFGLAADIEAALDRLYSPENLILDILKKLPDEAAVELLGAEGAGDAGGEPPGDPAAAPVVRLANQIIGQAVLRQASDIHIEHEEDATVVRYRVDGVLHNVLRLPRPVGEGPLVCRIKIMAAMDIADRRRPQDGRATLRVGAATVALRVSTIPTAFGEKVVLRVLDQRRAAVPLESLGLRSDMRQRLARLSELGRGIVLVTGPTGSGKTTTLYSLIHRMKSSDINIVTVEDPIEFKLPGVNQVQINERAGLTFAAALRSVLRQDPDVVLVGEIRDRETADIAFQAALSGHLVFSTLHTNDAVSTVSRLLDMGVEAFKMAPALSGVVAQRLARRLCPACRTEAEPTPALSELFRAGGVPARHYRAVGCARCANTGFSGRVALTELLEFTDPAVRDMVGKALDTGAFRAEAQRRGWLSPMSYDALWHLYQGDIPYEEAAAFLAPSEARPSQAEPAPARLAPPATAAPGAAPAGARILVVDDNADNRALARDALVAQGYAVAEAADGVEALEQVRVQDPDAVLLDIMMPRMDGLATLRRLRAESRSAGLPVLILTAMGEPESQALALEMGADDYLTKPFDHRVLVSRVRALLRRCAARSLV